MGQSCVRGGEVSIHRGYIFFFFMPFFKRISLHTHTHNRTHTVCKWWVSHLFGNTMLFINVWLHWRSLQQIRIPWSPSGTSLQFLSRQQDWNNDSCKLCQQCSHEKSEEKIITDKPERGRLSRETNRREEEQVAKWRTDEVQNVWWLLDLSRTPNRTGNCVKDDWGGDGPICQCASG